ncbi:MAG TPA: RluA family pseudouridine synthase [Candidatus Binatia bacterium]
MGRGSHYSILAMQEIVVPSQESPKKLENFLKKVFPVGYVRKLLRKNGARINGRRAKAEDLVCAGDRIQLYVEFEKKTSATKARSAIKLEIIYQDDSLLVIDKPAGIAVHEGKSVHKQDSVLGILEANYRGTDIRPQLVHRLDRDTSGLLLVAKNSATAKELEGRFQHGDVEKEYSCLVKGRLPLHEGNIDFPLPGRQGNPVYALTRYRVSNHFLDVTWVRAKIDTGRLHQIRLHFARLGYPVIMDEQHGDFAFNRRFRKQFGLKRQFLHAEKLALQHAGKLQQWIAPLPKDLTEVLKKLSARQL